MAELMDELDAAEGEIARLKRDWAAANKRIEVLTAGQKIANDMLTGEPVSSSKADRKAYMRDLMRRKRAAAKARRSE